MSIGVRGKTWAMTPLSETILNRLKASWAPLTAAGVLCLGGAVSSLLPVWGALVAFLVVALAAIIAPQPKAFDEAREWRPGPEEDPPVGPLVEALLDPAILLTSRGTVFAFNQAASQAVPHLKKGVPISFCIRVPEILDAVREIGQGAPGRVVEFIERVPVDRWIEARIGPVVHDKSHLPNFIVLSFDDLTHLRRAERMRVDFVANASHELRTPLAALLGFIETLQGPARSDPVARERFLDIMKSQANRMSRLIDDLLSLSRIEQREHLRPLDPVDLVEIVRGVLDGLSPLAAERAVEVVTSFPSGPVRTQGDRDELVRVVENLVENGIKYGQSGKKIEVSVKRVNEQGQIVIRDFGPGIPPEHLPRLTERFYRVDVGDSRDKGGTGLGLALVKHIMARHRGRLLIESTLGEGATFTVVLDLDEERSAA